jgi:lysophospholipase L1-like esterase
MKRLFAIIIVIAAIGNARAQDWANIKRYEEANSKVKPPAAKENRVVYMGDSITDFWITTDSLFFAGKPYFDRGISGQTTGQMLVRFREDVINLKPGVVIILAGINDIGENNGPSKLVDIFGNIVSMAELAKANNIKVILSSVLPVFVLQGHPTLDPVTEIRTLNEMIKTYAEKNNMVYLDYFTAMADTRKGLPSNLSNDGLHPNLEGYKIMEPLAVRAIDVALKKE